MIFILQSADFIQKSSQKRPQLHAVSATDRQNGKKKSRTQAKGSLGVQ